MHDPAGSIAALWDRLVAVADGLDDPDWKRATPCDEWDVHDLLAHCSGGQVELDGGTRVPPPEGWRPSSGSEPLDRYTSAAVAARRDWSPEELRTELRAAREGHVARLQRVEDWGAGVEGPLGPTTEEVLLVLRAYDLWVHLQDLRMALGQPLDIGDDSEAARAAHRFVLDRVGWVFAKRVTGGEDATLHLVVAAPAPVDAALTVRDGWGSLATISEPVDSTLRAAPEALTLLVSGREEPEAWRDRGLLEWAGPVAEQFVRRARFF